MIKPIKTKIGQDILKKIKKDGKLITKPLSESKIKYLQTKILNFYAKDLLPHVNIAQYYSFQIKDQEQSISKVCAYLCYLFSRKKKNVP